MGIKAGLDVEGGPLSSPISELFWYGAVSAFTDTNGVWHSIYLRDWSGGGGMGLWAENKTSSATDYTESLLCEGLPTDATYDVEIYWNYSVGAFNYTTTSDSSCGFHLEHESGFPTIGSAGTVNFMESSDFNATDFSSLQAYVQFSPSLVYLSSGTWTDATAASSYNKWAVETIGMSYDCVSPMEILVNSDYHPPPVSYRFNVSGC